MFRMWNRKLVLFSVALIALYALNVFRVADAKKVATPAQGVWTANTENRNSIIKDKAVSRQSFPTEYKLFNLNIDPLRQQLFSIVDNRQGSTTISLPNANGDIEQFEVFEASNFEPDLQAQYPQIRAYSGRGVTDRYATLKLSLSPLGIQTMVFRADADNEFIEPFSQDRTTYAVFRAQRHAGGLPWECSTEDQHAFADLRNKAADESRPESNTGEVRTVRLAQSNNGEYAGYFHATTACTPDDKTLVLQGFNATLTRVNGALEKDIAIHFNLIAATTNVIFCDPATDPYTTLGSWNGQLQTTLTNMIGEANYDIGHMFGASGGGGNAGCIGCVCTDGTKGRGITSPADAIPEGDNFDIDYVVHEMGHQIGANHSFSFQSEGPGPAQKEVGSGITIMGYAGITGQDVAPHSLDTFHEVNIAQIQTNLAGKTCPITTVMTANHPPVVATVSNVTIPISTPFALTGSATDPEGDPLTYQWEQNDTMGAAQTGSSSVASPTKATGPNWLSFAPTSSPTRFFPRLSTVQAGLFVTPTLPGGDAVANIEALSSVARILQFRLTVRDNRPYVPASTIGQTQFTDMVVQVNASAGPFKVTAPNTAVSWAGNSSHTITWDVAGTTAAPISVANVKILLSTDGGNTFPTTLSASTANDGTEVVNIPNSPTGTARIKVEAIGNIFYDISDVNFTITPSVVPNRPILDFDGDGKTDVGVIRVQGPTLAWYVLGSTSGFIGANFGNYTAGPDSDQPVPGDYDGDGKWDIAVFRPGTPSVFYILQSGTNTLRSDPFGSSTDDPRISQDFDGDGKCDLAVARPSGGTISWYILRSTLGFTGVNFGTAASDHTMRGDYDGDGKADVAVYRRNGGSPANTFFVLRSSDGAVVGQTFGNTDTDYILPGDFDGDHKTDFAVWRVTEGNWYWLQSSDGAFRALNFGVSPTDNPVPGDYDGDGKTDQAVWRNTGVFYINGSSSGFQATPWGQSGDRALAFGWQVR